MKKLIIKSTVVTGILKALGKTDNSETLDVLTNGKKKKMVLVMKRRTA